MSNLERAKKIAYHQHIDQFDKNGEPYINHVTRIKDSVESQQAKIVAVLHDTIEDTDLTLKDLKNEDFSESVIDALNAITKQNNETYMDYIERVSSNELATEVKIADLKDNMDINRIPEGKEEWFWHVRTTRYQKALDFLMPVYQANNQPNNSIKINKHRNPY